MPIPADQVTTLSPEQVSAARAAATASSRFIDPSLLRVARERIPHTSPAWRKSVTGQAEWALGVTPWVDTLTLLAAYDAEPVPPVAERREYVEDTSLLEERERKSGEWAELRKSLPVRVVVLHNYRSARHLETYVQGVDHIVVREPLSRGRMQRLAGEALCQVPSNSKHLLFDSPAPSDESRVPTCKACIGVASRMAPR